MADKVKVTCEFCGMEVNESALKSHQRLSKDCQKAQETAKSQVDESPDTEEIRGESPEGEDSWSKDKFNRNVWSEPNLLNVSIKDNRYSIRWGIKRKLRTHTQAGWEPVTYEELENFNELTLEHGESMTSIVTIKASRESHEMILLKIPKGLAEARKVHYRSKITTAKDLDRAARQEGLEGDGIKIN